MHRYERSDFLLVQASFNVFTMKDLVGHQMCKYAMVQMTLDHKCSKRLL